MGDPDGSVGQDSHCSAGSAAGTATRNGLHGGSLAAERREALGGLDANECRHGFAKQVCLVHAGIGHCECLVVEIVVESNGCSHEFLHLK